MTTAKKAMTLALCAVLLVVGSVAGTMAYLTDDDTVTNTFTVGKVGIALDEADVKPDGTLDTTNSRVKKNEYHLIPGHTYIKDPTVTVDAGSEAAYVRMLVKVENIDQLKAALPNRDDTAKYYASNGTFLLQALCVDENGICTWNSDTWNYKGYNESSDSKTGTYEFWYNGVVGKSNNKTSLDALFTHITVPGEIDNDNLECLENVQIVVNAHAIQADGFSTADEAWDAVQK